MNIYVASSWLNEKQPAVVAALRAAGHTVYDFKNPAPGTTGFNWLECDPSWQSWTPEKFIEMLDHPVAQAGFERDIDALYDAEACVMVLPCGRSSSLETGWAAGHGKPTIILLAAGEPELMFKIADAICTTIEQVVAELGRLEEHRERFAVAYNANDLRTGARCASCGFEYSAYNGHIIPCPKCEVDRLRRLIDVKAVKQLEAEADSDAQK